MKGRAILLAGVMFLGLSLLGIQAHAYSITCGVDCPTDVWTTSDNSNLKAGDIETITGISGLTLLYKSEVGGGEEGSLAGSYDTTFANTPTDPSEFTISYVSGAFADCPDCILVVKDGNHDPAQYLFNLENWDGMTDIEGTGFWSNQGGISNVAIWGKSASVPEPTSLMLLGAGLAGLGIWRQKFA